MIFFLKKIQLWLSMAGASSDHGPGTDVVSIKRGQKKVYKMRNNKVLEGVQSGEI